MKNEPVRLQAAIIAALNALIVCAQAFGLDWTGEQVATVMGAANAVLVLVGAAWARSRVTPI